MLTTTKQFGEFKSRRLSGYDYSTTGGYFVTIRFYDPPEDLDIMRRLFQTTCSELAKRGLSFLLDEWVIMDDHLHMIFLILEHPDAKPKTASEVVRSIKARVTYDLHQLGYASFKWQSSFYDRIIRTENELFKFREYIAQNPLAKQLKSGAEID